MALLPVLADSVRMSATLGADAHPSFYPNPVIMSEIEHSSHVTLTFTSAAAPAEEVFQKPVVDVVAEFNNSAAESQEESPLPPLRRKRAIRRYAECSSGDEYVPNSKSVRRRSHVSYRESDSSSEGESSDFEHLPQALSSSKQEGTQKLKLVLELLSQSKTVETVLHVGCRIRSLENFGAELPPGVLRGCPSCRDCQKVLARWCPDAGRRPCLEDAPVFYPTEEEFKHPLEYLAKIRARAEPYGICRVVPPVTWRPPCPLKEDSPELRSMQFPTRVQQVHKLQVRKPSSVKECLPTQQASKKRRGRATLGRMGNSATCTTNAANPEEQQEFFGFEPGDSFPLGAFEKYANDFKEQYFHKPQEQQSTMSEKKWEPTIEMIEGEYWRIVEQATDQIEVLYGADVETWKYRSGFPMAKPGAESTSAYEKSGWNLNNIARFPGSMLSFEEGDISGVLVPWLYIGMCFSSFCWHVEDHHFYSLNYMHWGAPKIWYGVPGSAAEKLEAAMKKHLPDLFDEQPDLLHKLVTQLSPSFLKQEGVPVYRLEQKPGDFVITFPHAYHSGFNSGFNVAEAVNVAPVDWLPHGQAAVELYRDLHRKTSVSHDKLLLGAARVAVKMWWHSQRHQMHSEAYNNAPLMSQMETKGLEPDLVCAWQAYCGEGGVLAKAVKERVDMEHARRDSIRMVAGEASDLSMKQMDDTYDMTDERECDLCKYDLHLSAIGCQCCPEKFACLLHGHLLCLCPWSKKTLYYRYNLDELGLLLAAVEGRPGAVADWTKQESQVEVMRMEITPSVHVTNEERVVGDTKKNIQPLCSVSFSMADCDVPPVHMECPPCFPPTTKLDAIKPKSGFFLETAMVVVPPDTGALSSLSNSINRASLSVNAKGDNLVRNNYTLKEVRDAARQPERVVFPRSGHGQQQVIGTTNVVNREILACQSGTIMSAKPTPLALAEVIFLSDDDDEDEQEEDAKIPVNMCKFNVARELSVETGVSEHVNHLVDRVADSAVKKEGQGSMACGGSWGGGGGHGDSVEAVMMKTSSAHVLLPCKPSVSTELQRPKEEFATCLKPTTTTTDLVTVVQRNTPNNSWVGPRVARVRSKRDVELLSTGHIVLREGWHTSRAIYPAGFRSQTKFFDVEDVYHKCVYVSEIMDCGAGTRPLFKVTHPTKREVYLNESIDACWHEIQNQVNEEIISRRAEDRSRQLPPLLPPPNGLEMFGLTSASIIQAVEALDPLHQCLEYWRGKLTRQDQVDGNFPGQSQGPTLPGYPRALQSKEPEITSVNTIGRSVVMNSNCSMQAADANYQHSPPTGSSIRRGKLIGPSGNHNQKDSENDVYSILQGFFHKANVEELGVLYRVFRDTQGAEWRTAFRALDDEVQKRFC